MNKKCIALTPEEYKEVIRLLREGFTLNGICIKPNNRVAGIAVTQATLGLRLGDVLELKLSSFIKDGNRYRLDIIEQKTGKVRNFTVPVEVYSFIQGYAMDNGIGKEAKLFQVGKRQVERHLNKVFSKIGLPLRNYGTHSFRKMWATQVYIESDYNLVLVQQLLQHSSVEITRRYIGIGSKEVEEVLSKTTAFLV